MTDLESYEFLTTDEAAALMRVSRKTVLRRIRSGQLPACRLGREYRIRADDLVRRVVTRHSDAIYLDDNASNPIDPLVRQAITLASRDRTAAPRSRELIGGPERRVRVSGQMVKVDLFGCGAVQRRSASSWH